MIDRNALTVIEGDARISCRSLQDALGFARIDHLHRLIRAHEDELRDFGEVFLFEGENPSRLGGRPIKTFLLNEHQATAICLWAETPKARAGRKLIIEVFTAWRKGQLPEMTAPVVDPFEAMAGRSGHVRDHLQAIAAMPALAREATHLPIWTNGRRPVWWGDYELRTFLTESHRQMTLAECCAEVERRFGRAFSTSSLQRYWAALDRAIGPGPRHVAPRPPRSPKKKEAA